MEWAGRTSTEEVERTDAGRLPRGFALKENRAMQQWQVGAWKKGNSLFHFILFILDNIRAYFLPLEISRSGDSCMEENGLSQG